MSWILAIKAHALANNGKYTIPKKDTAEYAAVKAIQAKLASEKASDESVPVKVRAPRKPKVANVVEAPPVPVGNSEAPPAKPKKAKIPNVVPEIVAVVPPVEVKVAKVKTAKIPNEPVVRRKRIAKVAAEGVRLETSAKIVSFE